MSSYKQLRFITFICMLTLGQCLTSKFISQEDDRVIIIDQDGTSDLECCMYGNCHCSNLSLALEHIQDNTEIRIQSVVSLQNVVVFENVSNVKITGNSNVTVRCADHQGGLVGKIINYIVIQGITWDTCNGITMLTFTHIYIMECKFLNFALTLHGLGSVNINGSVFSGNSSNVNVLAQYVAIHSSKFYGNSKSGSLVINVTNISGTRLHSINVTIEGCEFNDILKHCVYCIGSASLLPTLLIISSNFTDNANTAVNVEHCNITLNNVTFYNNVNENNGYINDGGAIGAYNGTVNLTGNVLFYYNRAGNNGGAIYLTHSILYASQVSILFHNNTAKNGGAIYIGEGSELHGFDESRMMFDYNSANANGGAMYFDLHLINDATVIYRLGCYLLGGCILNPWQYIDYIYGSNNYAGIGSRAYFNTQFLNMCFPIMSYYPDRYSSFASSSPCSIYSHYDNSTVTGNITNIDINGGVLEFWLHDLNLDVTVIDHFGNLISPINASFWCCNNAPLFLYNCTIDSHINSFSVTSKNTIIECSSTDVFTCTVILTDHKHYFFISSDIDVTVERSADNCNDIAHAYYNGVCLPICLSYSSQKQCVNKDILPGYWYDNAFKLYVTSCPTGYCNELFQFSYLIYPSITTNTFPDRDSQCNQYRSGLACGECNYDAGYAIQYDTTKCTCRCLTTSVTYNLLILFAVSFFYWVVIIAFIFVLLHFKFDITAGYAYGLLFYYSVLEQLVNDLIVRNFVIASKSYDTFNLFHYEFAKLKILPFLSSIGILKVPFTGFMRLCFGEAMMIDYLMLGYIHPLIVTFLVVVIFILARNFVLVARTIGKYVNSKSICILLLLSYSSVTYNSMQLLKPLPVFDSDGRTTAIQVYWSPTVKYFHDRHLCYGIIAILCELIIGIGIPLILIFERYLIRYCNINFTSLKPVIDQLKGCYKEEYRWFAAYYLLCRQVFYGVNYCLEFLAYHDGTSQVIIDTPFSKFIIILTVSIMIMLIHVWFQPYKHKGLNILDSFILLTLIGLIVSSLEVYLYRVVTIVFWFLPLLILINYLAYFTKLKHLMIPCSCAAVLTTIACFSGDLGIITFLFFAISVIVFIAYIVSVVKSLYSRCCKTKPRYLAINEQNDDIDENNDNNINIITEVSCHEH